MSYFSFTALSSCHRFIILVRNSYCITCSGSLLVLVEQIKWFIYYDCSLYTETQQDEMWWNCRYAIARGKIYCVCKDRTSVWRNMPPRIRCVAWCAVNVKGLGIVKTVQRGHNESFTVSCPRGKKVRNSSSVFFNATCESNSCWSVVIGR